VSYEGQAASELEAACDEREEGAYPIVMRDAPGLPEDEREAGQPPASGSEAARVMDVRPAVATALDDLDSGVPVSRVAARFHNGLARATADACVDQARRHGLDAVVLSGGVFQNRLLLERTAWALSRAGLRVLVPERLPPNDGGIAYGQAAIAAVNH
jgi:hydrogenase maturation protein HypF